MIVRRETPVQESSHLRALRSERTRARRTSPSSANSGGALRTLTVSPCGAQRAPGTPLFAQPLDGLESGASALTRFVGRVCVEELEQGRARARTSGLAGTGADIWLAGPGPSRLATPAWRLVVVTPCALEFSTPFTLKLGVASAFAHRRANARLQIARPGSRASTEPSRLDIVRPNIAADLG